ncbi:MAG: hypothetical protein LBP61_00215, partial [Desulfovibrio sp.]|nr:hypothetical protein [Desulfovibrio sp.]
MRIFLVLPLLALLAAPTLPAWSAPARTAAVKTAAQTAKETESLQALQRRFEALDADAKRGLLREHWLRLIADCAALAAASKGETQVQAAFLAARGREELSNRSHSGADRRQAIAAYADLAGTYPRSALAPRSLYRQARLLGVILGRVKEADAVLEALLRRYPQSRAAGEAKALRAALAAGAKTPAAAKADPQAKKTA